MSTEHEEQQNEQLLINDDASKKFFEDLCKPFYEFSFNSNDSDFSLDFVSKVLIPKAIENIKDYDGATLDAIPMFVKVIIDNFDMDGLSLLDKTIFKSLEELISISNLTKPSKILDVYIQAMDNIKDSLKENYLLETISQYSSSPETNFRIIATKLIPFVNDPKNIERVKTNFVALSLDRVPQVRTSVINNLKNCKFDQSVIDSILTSSVHDLATSVQRTAATMIGVVSPHLIEPLKDFLSRRETAKAALKSVKNVVAVTGFTCLVDAFQNAMVFQPKNSCAVILNISRVVKKEEHDVLLSCAMQMKNQITLINYLFKFSEVFENKDIFLDFLDPSSAKKWRVRDALLSQCLLFVPTFGRRLIPIAEKFSKDDIAIVRDHSVSLWTSLINHDKSCFTDFQELVHDEHFQFRLVVCKTLGELNIPELEEVKLGLIKQLINDPISNVRFCMARYIASNDPQSFETFYANSTEPEIIQLKEEQSNINSQL